jgi:thiamine pyrophosphate-dependent acetolactate synthase large subunit-like protein
VEAPDEVEPALQKALTTDQPTFIDILTEPETVELPPVEKFHKARRAKGE